MKENVDYYPAALCAFLPLFDMVLYFLMWPSGSPLGNVISLTGHLTLANLVLWTIVFTSPYKD